MINNGYEFKINDKILKRLVSEENEELLSKRRAKELFDKKILEKFEVGTFKGLQEIHKYLFQDIFETAGVVRIHDISKDDTLFCRAIYLEENLKIVSRMTEDTFDEIVKKYVEMNIAHPFREGNGRSTRIWLDLMLKANIKQIIDWNQVDKDEYLSAMERSVVKDIEIKYLLKQALTNKINDRNLFMKGIDASYYYEGYNEFKTEEV